MHSKSDTNLVIEEVSLFGPEVSLLPLLDEGGSPPAHGEFLHVALHADLSCPTQGALPLRLLPLAVGIQILDDGNLFKKSDGGVSLDILR